MKTKKIISVLLVVLLTMLLGVTALADETNYNWVPVPTSPNGLQKGDVWFDFSKLFTGNLTAQEQAELARLNAAAWYADFDALMVKCVSSDPNLNGVYSNQHAWINCTVEVGVSWVPVSKTLAGLHVGDYYIDKDVFYQTAEAGYFAYFSAQYDEEYDDPMPAGTAAQLTAQCQQITDTQFNSNNFGYNPGGNQYHYQLNGMPFPYTRCMIGAGIANQTMIVVDALAASIRQVDANTLAASPWIRVASSVDDVGEGGYYLDFDDTQAVMTAFNLSAAPTEEDMALIKSGEWYADLNRGVVTGKIIEPASLTGMEEDITVWIPESVDLFALLKVKPVTQPEAPSEPEEPATPDQSGSDTTDSPSFLQGLRDFFQRIIKFFRNLFNR